MSHTKVVSVTGSVLIYGSDGRVRFWSGSTVTPDLDRAVKGRRKNLNRIWSSKEWKEKKAEFLKKNPYCAMHLSVGLKVPAVLPHHPYRNSYKGHYTDLELSACVAYCARCHFSLHHGRKLCPVCKEKYPMWDQEVCRFCFDKANPGLIQARERFKEEQKAIKKKLRKEQSDKARAWKKEHQKVNK